jgi:hypothetical protein
MVAREDRLLLLQRGNLTLQPSNPVQEAVVAFAEAQESAGR